MSDQPNGLQSVADRYGVSLDAVRHVVRALETGHGRMAQFDHPDLGGFGQWSGIGMTMIGDMFNNGLRARVDALCTELATSLPPAGWSEPARPSSGWPTDWGAPATSGSQNGMRYAYFPSRRRLVIESGGRVAVYDTGAYDISGVSQQQGGGTSLRFSGRGGYVDLENLTRLDAAEASPAEPQAEVRPFTPEPFTQEFVSPDFDADAPADAPPGPHAADDILGTIERLSGLQRKGILTEAEFAAKKAELLARL